MAKVSIEILVPVYATAAAKKVWLTFDDGPHPKYTKTVLDTLNAEGVKAAFFVIGKNVKQVGSALVKRAKDEGHCIGNHSFSHTDLTTLNVAQVRDEIKKTHDLIEPYLGGNTIFRPPYGASNPQIDAIIAEQGYRNVLWNVDTLDWDPAYQPDRWVQHGVDQIRNRDRSQVLAHDIHRTTADNVALFISRIRAIGSVTFEPCATLSPADRSRSAAAASVVDGGGAAG